MSSIPTEILVAMFLVSYVGFIYFFVQFVKSIKKENIRIKKLNKTVENILNYKPNFTHPVSEPSKCPREMVIDELSRQKLVYSDEDESYIWARSID